MKIAVSHTGASVTILNILDQLQSDNSRIAKEAVLKANLDNELLKRVFVAALNPNINYYIKKIPHYVASGDKDLNWALDNLQHKIASRLMTGHAAKDELVTILSNLSADDAIVVERVIGRDLKCGVSESTVNKIWKGLVPETPYCRCSSLDRMKNPNWEKGLYSQKKLDGSYCNVNVSDDGSLDIFTRNGTRYDASKFSAIADDLREHVGWQFHGELLVKEDGKILPRQLGNGVLNSVASGGDFGPNQTPQYVVWDCIPISECVVKGKSTLPYEARFKNLVDLIAGATNVELVETRVVYSMADALEHYKECLANGEEGTILKYKSMLWADGTSKEQFKLKLEVVVDLIVTGYKEGKGKNASTFGSLTCGSSDGLLEVNVSGFTDAMRSSIWDNIDNTIGKIIAVKSNSIMYGKTEGELHSLFLPRFEEIREDKTTADTFKQIEEQFNNAIKI